MILNFFFFCGNTNANIRNFKVRCLRNPGMVTFYCGTNKLVSRNFSLDQNGFHCNENKADFSTTFAVFFLLELK